MKNKQVSRTSSLLVLLLILLSVYGFEYITKPTYTVSRVIDGDTIELATGEIVRLIGVDAPEKNQCFFEESKEELQRLTREKEITMKAGVYNMDKDEYGRLLRYVYDKENRLVNIEIVRNGYAKFYSYFPTHLEGLFSSAESEARENRAGLWKECN